MVCRVYCVLLCFIAVGFLPDSAVAQSANDLTSRIQVDGSVADFTADETVFRTPTLCPTVAPCTFEEPLHDSRWSRLQDVEQLYVTWDAGQLYVAAVGVIDGSALMLLLDVVPGGIDDLFELENWSRAISFSRAFRPDLLIAVLDGRRQPEVWRLPLKRVQERISPDSLTAIATFQGAKADGVLEVALPWRTIFPKSERVVLPGGVPTIRLPAENRGFGLRMMALVVHSVDGFSAGDVAPDASLALPVSPRLMAHVDRSVIVDIDADNDGLVEFGAAIQTQETRFSAPASAATKRLTIGSLRTFDTFRIPVMAETRLLLADAGRKMGFAFELRPSGLPIAYVSVSIFSVRGQRVRELYRDAARTRQPATSPFGEYGRSNDVWDGLDSLGNPVPGGKYILRLSVGLNPGQPIAHEQRTIVVVR